MAANPEGAPSFPSFETPPLPSKEEKKTKKKGSGEALSAARKEAPPKEAKTAEVAQELGRSLFGAKPKEGAPEKPLIALFEGEHKADEKPKAEEGHGKEKAGEPRPEPGQVAEDTGNSAEKPDQPTEADKEHAETAEVVPLDELSDKEERKAAQDIVEHEQAAVTKELAEMQPDDNAEPALAAETFLNRSQEGLQDESTPVEQALDAAYKEAAELHAPDVNLLGEEAPEATTEAAEQPATTHEPEGALPLPEVANAEATDADPTGAAYAAGGTPPGIGGPPGPTGYNAGFAGGFNAAPAVGAAGHVEHTTETAANTGSDLLLGGLLGYFIGRRRGRIKTERRFKKIQDRLEREIRSIQNNVAQKETQIRELVRERTDQAHRASQQVEQLTAERMNAEAALQRATAEAPSFQERVQSIEERPAAIPLGLAEAAHAATAETHPTQSSETIYDREAPADAAHPEVKRAETIILTDPNQAPLQQVLEASHDVVVGATTLNRVFETNLISERGLRRVMAEYRRGGDFRKVLSEELLIHERDHELDPRLRDKQLEPPEQPPAFMPPQSIALPGNTVSGLYNEADAPAAPAESAAQQRASVSASVPEHVRTTMAAATFVGVVILAVLITVLVVVLVSR